AHAPARARDAARRRPRAGSRRPGARLDGGRSRRSAPRRRGRSDRRDHERSGDLRGAPHITLRSPAPTKALDTLTPMRRLATAAVLPCSVALFIVLAPIAAADETTPSTTTAPPPTTTEPGDTTTSPPTTT